MNLGGELTSTHTNSHSHTHSFINTQTHSLTNTHSPLSLSLSQPHTQLVEESVHEHTRLNGFIQQISSTRMKRGGKHRLLIASADIHRSPCGRVSRSQTSRRGSASFKHDTPYLTGDFSCCHQCVLFSSSAVSLSLSLSLHVKLSFGPANTPHTLKNAGLF